MLVKLDQETPGIGVNIPKILEVSPPRYYVTFAANLLRKAFKTAFIRVNVR